MADGGATMPGGEGGEILSICIPTWNRALYLRDLLEMILREVRLEPGLEKAVHVYISDNASPDQTRKIVEAAQAACPGLVEYHCNATNLGGEFNVLHVRTLAKGKYIWVLGDDEILCDKSLGRVVQVLREHDLGLFLAYDSVYKTHLKRPAHFQDYRAFAVECVKSNPHALAEHSLISSNIYRRGCFDAAYAHEMSHTNYPQMYGMIRPLVACKAAVYVPEFDIITVRTEYPYPMAVPGWADVDARWFNYFTWLREELKLPELDPQAPSRIAARSARLRVLKNPLGFVWNNRRSLLNPSALAFFFRRFFGLQRRG